MRYKSIRVIFFTLIILFGVANVRAQIFFKSEYITPSNLKGEDGKNIGGKGGLKTIDGGIRIPVSIRIDENNKPTVWAVGLTGTYASLDNKDISKEHSLSEILNVQIGLIHLRPLNDRWSILASLGVGVFSSDLEKISRKSILEQGGILFIKHAKPNFDWGIGLAMNNALGYPMIFPSFYLDWRLGGKYDFKLSMYDSFTVDISSKISDDFKLSFAGESKGLMATAKKDGKDMYFVTQYGYAGIQPEYKIAKRLAVFATCGISLKRETYYQSRTLKAFYKSDDNYPYFGISAYFAGGIKYGF